MNKASPIPLFKQTLGQVLGLLLLLLCVVPAAKAVPTVLLDAPSTVVVGQPFAVAINVYGFDGVQTPGSLVRFGFCYGYNSDRLQNLGYSIAAPFHDDSPAHIGPCTGSVYPGLQGDPILLGYLYFLGIQPGAGSIDIGDQGDAPLISGLFSDANPDRYEFGNAIGLTVVANNNPVPDRCTTFYLLAPSLGIMAWAGHANGLRRRDQVRQE